MTTEEKRLKRNAYQNSWRLKNLDKARARDRARWPKKREAERGWREKNRERLAANKRKWLDSNPDKRAQYYANRKAKYDPRKRKDSQLKELYGMSVEAYESMLRGQNNCCALCGEKIVEGRGRNGPHVDHDHAAGHVRGILHAQCNVGLGSFRDDPDMCDKAAAYLRRTKP